MGDFNDLPIGEICSTCNFKQIVNVPTRKKAMLDLILTNADNDLYETPITLPKIGDADHDSVLVKPKNYEKPKTVKKKIQIRKFPESALCGFGNWITTFDWSEQFKLMDVDDKVSYFATISWNMVEIFFPLVTVKLTDNDKEWMTPYAKLLIQTNTKSSYQKRS